MKIVPAGKIVGFSPKKMAKFGIGPDRAETLSGWRSDYLDKKSALEKALASSGCIGSLKKYEKMTQADLDKLVENYSLEDYQLEEIQALHQAYLEAAFDLETNFCLLREGKDIPIKEVETPKEQSASDDKRWRTVVDGEKVIIRERPSAAEVYAKAPIETIEQAKEVISSAHARVSRMLDEIRFMRSQNAESRRMLREKLDSLRAKEAEDEADFAKSQVAELNRSLDELDRETETRRKAAGLDTNSTNTHDDVPGK